jgi:hypothetical protein
MKALVRSLMCIAFPAALLYVTGAPALSDEPVVIYPLATCVKNADVIFIGYVQKTNWEQTLGNNWIWHYTDSPYKANYTLAVERLLKGAAPAGTRSIDLKDVQIVNRYSCPEPGTHGIFMLKKSATGAFAFVNPQYPIFRIAGSASNQAITTDDPFATVVHALVKFLAAPVGNLRAQSLTGIDYGKQQVYEEVADLLDAAPLELVKSDLHFIVASPSNSQLQRLLAFDCLMLHQDFDSVEQLKAILSNPPDSSVAPGLIPTGKATLLSPRGSLLHFGQRSHTYGEADPNRWRSSPKFEPAMEKLVAALTPLLRSRDLCTRQDVADIFSQIDTEAIIAPLAEIALNDSDDYVKECALSGISSAAVNQSAWHGMEGAPIGDEADFWRRWVAFKDKSGSPLVVSKLDDVRPSKSYTHYLHSGGYYKRAHIADLTEDSDLIVVGRLVPDATLAPTGSGPSSMADRSLSYYRLSVDRVFKQSGQYDLSHLAAVSSGPAPSDYGMFFLRHVGGNMFEQARRESGTGYLFPNVCATAVTTKPAASADPTHQIQHELATVLATPVNQIGLKQPPRIRSNATSGIRTAAAIAVIGGNGVMQTMALPRSQAPPNDCSGTDLVYADAAAELKGWADPQLLSSLRAMLSSPALEPQCRLWITNVLVSCGDFGALNDVKSILLDPPSSSDSIDPAIRALAETIHSAASLADKDKALQRQKISILTTLLHSKHVAVRRAAIATLAATPWRPRFAPPAEYAFTMSILESIAKVGLYDPDLEVRRQTVAALASRTHEPWAYHLSLEDNNQAKAIRFWRAMLGIGELHVP